MQVLDPASPPSSAKQARSRRRVAVILGAIGAAALIAVVVFVVVLRPASAPQPYGGPATARDMLTQVVADPSGGIWAVGRHIGTTAGSNSLDNPYQDASTFILHLEHGHWVTSFTLPTVETGELLGRIAMVTADEGWAVGGVLSGGGGSSFLLHYLHGTWSEAPVHPHGTLNDIAMVAADEGWAVGGTPVIDDNRLLYSNTLLLHYHAGTWTPISSPQVDVLQSIAMVSPSEGWAVGAKGFLHYSGGVWSAVPSPVSTPGSVTPVDASVPTAIAMTSASDGWAVGLGGLILQYSGGTWSQVASPTTSDLNAMALTSPDDGWAVGGSFESFASHTCVLLHYTGGVWGQVPCPMTQPLAGIAMVSADEGWAVGLGGTILHYTGGAWSVVNGAK